MELVKTDAYNLLKKVIEDKGTQWKWIARDGDDTVLWVYANKPRKSNYSPTWIGDDSPSFPQVLTDRENSLNFIRGDDEEPYNIQELIDTYENTFSGYHSLPKHEEVRRIKEAQEDMKDKNVRKVNLEKFVFKPTSVEEFDWLMEYLDSETDLKWDLGGFASPTELEGKKII